MRSSRAIPTAKVTVSLRWRMVLGLAAVIGVAAVAAHFAVLEFVQHGFETTDQQETKVAVERLSGVLHRQVDAFTTTAMDWSLWDDLSDYLHDPSEDFFQSSLGPAAYTGMGWDAVVLRLSDGTIRLAQGIDRENAVFTAPPSGLLALDALYGPADPASPTVKGFARLGGEPYLVASLPVLRTDRSASPSPGRLIAAKRVKGQWLQTQRALTALDFALLSLDEAAQGFPETTSALMRDEGPQLVPESKAHMLGLSAIDALDGSPLFVVKLRKERTARAQGVLLGQTASRTVLIFGLLLVALLYVVVGRVALTPIVALERAAHALSAGTAKRVEHARRDEIGMLAETFNRMARTLTQRDRALTDANEEMHQLLDAMDDAVLSFDLNGRLGVSRSLSATELLGPRLTAHTHIVDVLFGGLDPNAPERAAFAEWLTAARDLAETDLPFEELAALAPTKCTVRSDAGVTHLRLAFRPIRRSASESTTHDSESSARGALKGILMVATDETALVQKTLEAAARELALTTQIQQLQERAGHEVHVLVRALERAEALLTGVQRLISTTRSIASEEVDRLALMGRAHSLKSTALSYKLHDLFRVANALERALDIADEEHSAIQPSKLELLVDEGLAAIANIRGEIARQSPIGTAVLDQTPVSSRALVRLHGLLQRLDTSTPPTRDELILTGKLLLAVPFGQATAPLSDACARWARHEGVEVALELEGRGELITQRLATCLDMALEHLVRNSLAHGIEAPEARREAHKPAQATIRIACAPGERGPVITVEDDGRGFQRAPLLAKAIETGRLTEAEASRLTDAEVWPLAFEAGASTRGRVDDLAGRGVGLTEVRRAMNDAGYTINVDSSPQGTRFTLCPMDDAHHAVSLLPSLPSPANDQRDRKRRKPA